MMRLIPPGNRQDPLLRALISDHNEDIDGLTPPNRKQNPLLKLLKADKKDQSDREHLSLPQKEEIFQNLIEKPSAFREDFHKLSDSDQNDVLTMIEKSGKRNKHVIENLSQKKFGKLRVSKDPLLTKTIPEYTQSDAFRDLINRQEGETENNSFDEVFLDSLKKASSDREGKTDYYYLIIILPYAAQRLLSFYQWSKELMTRLNPDLWDQIKAVLGQVIKENLGR